MYTHNYLDTYVQEEENKNNLQCDIITYKMNVEFVLEITII